jgi:hypothetical protein
MAAPDSADALGVRRRASANVEQPGAQASPMPTSPVAHQPNLDQAGPALLSLLKRLFSLD